MTKRFNKVAQSGSFLLEALIAIVIFSMGILAIVGMQAAAIKNSGESKYRSDANLLANELIGRMWVSDRTALQTNFAGIDGAGGTEYVNWINLSVVPTATGATKPLPGVTLSPPQNLPIVTVSSAGFVSVYMYWQTDLNDANTKHSLVMTAQIK